MTDTRSLVPTLTGPIGGWETVDPGDRAGGLSKVCTESESSPLTVWRGIQMTDWWRYAT